MVRIALLGLLGLQVFAVTRGFLVYEFLPTWTYAGLPIMEIAVALSACFLNYVAYKLVFSLWQLRTLIAKAFVSLCLTYYVLIELFLAHAAILSYSELTAFEHSITKKAHNTLVALDQVEIEVASLVRARLGVYTSREKESREGRDLSGEQRCGTLCKSAQVHADQLLSGFGDLLELRNQVPLDDAALAEILPIIELRSTQVERLASRIDAFERLALAQEEDWHSKQAKFLPNMPKMSLDLSASIKSQVSRALDDANLFALQFRDEQAVDRRSLTANLQFRHFQRVVQLEAKPVEYLAMAFAIFVAGLGVGYASVLRSLVDRPDTESLEKVIETETKLVDQWSKLFEVMSRKAAMKDIHEKLFR